MDETIRIDAKIDTKQAIQDIEELRGKIRSFSNSTKKYAENATKALKEIANTKIERSMENIAEAVEDAGEAIEEMAETAEDTAKAIEEISEAVEEIAEPADNAAEAVEEISDSAEEVSESISEVVEETQEMDDKMDEATDSGKEGMMDLATATDTVDTSVNKLTISSNILDKALKKLSVYAILRLAAKGMKEIFTTTEESYASIRKASTMFGEVAVDQENLVNKLSKIAAETGSDIATLGEAVYQAMSAGVAPTEDMADVLSAVEKSAKLASGGFTDTETAMSATLSVLNAYKMDIKDLDKIQGILLQTQNKGVTTVGQLGSALSKVTPTAAAFGVSFKQVASAIALMTKQGTNTEVATTALSTVLSELGKSGTNASNNLEKAAQSAGLSSTSFKELLKDGKNLSEILTIMSDYAEQNGLSMVDMFGSIEAGRAALQLAGSNTEDYNKILASMADTNGLVQESFDKTISPAEKLSSAFNNLVVTIGTKLKPTWDELMISMADLFTKLTNNETAGGKMKTSFDELKIALDEYKKAEEQARIETNALNNSILSLAKTNLNRALYEASMSYTKSSKTISDYKDSIYRTDLTIERAQKNLDYYASKTEYTTDELQKMAAEERALAFQFERGEDFLASFNTQNDILTSNMTKRIELSAKLSEAEQTEADFVETLAMLYAEDAESAEFLLTAYPELTDKVKERSKAYVEQKKTIEGIVDAGQQLANNDPAPIISKNAEELQKNFDSLTEKYKKLTNASDVLGDSYYSQEQYLSDLESLYAGALVEAIDASSEAMENLVKEIERVKGAIETADDATIDWKGTWDDFSKQGIASAIKSTSAAFNEIFNREENLKNLEEELSGLYDDKTEQMDSLAEAQKEYTYAEIANDEEGMKQAQKKMDKINKSINATQKLIDVTEDEKKAVQDGSSIWKAYGASAMEALAAVLEGLGGELAAKAALSMFSLSTLWMSPLLAAGSIAAFAAASWARSQKFASGGIVGGTSYSGDNVLARVNSGELILNMAQQDNVAKALSTLADMSGLGTGQGGGVAVYLSGASFYGLDEPAVGKAIYDNIQQLHYEGVI